MAEFIYARNFKELVAYQAAFDLSRRVFELSKAFPEEEKFSLTSQIRRSSRSIGAQIAEAWAKRKYERHFVSKLTDADGEQMETQHWVRTAFSCGYIEKTFGMKPDRLFVIEGKNQGVGCMIRAKQVSI